MKCIKCGHELKDGAIYCIRCGAMQISMDGERLTEKGWSEVNSIKGGHAREFKAAPEGKGRRIAIVIVVILVIAAIIAGVAYALTRPAPEEDDPSLTTSVFSSTSSSATSTTSSTSSTSASSTSTTSSSSSAASSSAASAASQASTQSQATTTNDQPAAQPEPEPYYEPEPEPYYEPEPQPAPASQVGDQPSYAPEPTSGDYVLADSSSRYYSRSELEGMSVSDLYYARNEIFARHGRMFHRSDLQSYFESKSWYNPTYTPEQWESMGDQLSDVERQNSILMKEVEDSKGSSYL